MKMVLLVNIMIGNDEFIVQSDNDNDYTLGGEILYTLGCEILYDIDCKFVFNYTVVISILIYLTLYKSEVW